MTVFQRIQDLCRAEGITISALEAKLGFSHYSLTAEKATNIRSDRLLRIAQYFGVSTDWILTGEEQGKQTFTLTEQEQTLIKLFRNLTDSGKDMMLAQYTVFANAGFVKKSADSDKVEVVK